ncbi:MAG: type 1 glutamine amidotransferase [Dysgonomonas sp.]
MIRVHYLQHVPFEGLGYIADWVANNKYSLSETRLYDNPNFPPLESFDMLVIMGGPMGTYEEDKYPWLKGEKKFVRKAIEAGKIVVGICLGSQIIASALGAAVYPNKEKEIGWLPVTFTDSLAQNLFESEEASPIVFQWHGDTFDLPEGARLLASSEACANQAFLYKDKVLGIQFHFEATRESFSDMLDNGLDELKEGRYIQSEDFIRTNTQHIPLTNRMIETALNKLAKTI